MGLPDRYLFLFMLFAVPGLHAAAEPPNQDPDVLVFTDGEKLIGELERATAGTVTFKSEAVGEVTVEWSKVKELRSSRRFAVIEKGVKLRKHADTSKVPQGTLSASGQSLTIQPAPGAAPQTVPVANAVRVIDESAFRSNMVETPGLLQAWNGSVTAGVSLVEATQHSETLTASIHLVRTIPMVSWMDTRNRTIIDFSTSYGKVSEPTLRH